MAYTEEQRTKLIENDKYFMLARKKQIEGMYFCVQAFNVARIVIAIGVILLIIFK